MSELRNCPDCEQGKHQNCDNEVLSDDDQWVRCPCTDESHKMWELLVDPDPLYVEPIDERIRDAVSNWDDENE